MTSIIVVRHQRVKCASGNKGTTHLNTHNSLQHGFTVSINQIIEMKLDDFEATCFYRSLMCSLGLRLN